MKKISHIFFVLFIFLSLISCASKTVPGVLNSVKEPASYFIGQQITLNENVLEQCKDPKTDSLQFDDYKIKSFTAYAKFLKIRTSENSKETAYSSEITQLSIFSVDAYMPADCSVPDIIFVRDSAF